MADRHAKTAATRRARVQAEILRKTKLLLSERSPLVITYGILSTHVGFTAETIRRHFPDIGVLTLRAYERELTAVGGDDDFTSPREALTSLIFRLANTIVHYPSLGDGLRMESSKPDYKQSPLYGLANDLEHRITAFRKEKYPEARSSHQKSRTCLRATIMWALEYAIKHPTPDVDEIEAFAHMTVTNLGR